MINSVTNYRNDIISSWLSAACTSQWQRYTQILFINEIFISLPALYNKTLLTNSKHPENYKGWLITLSNNNLIWLSYTTLGLAFINLISYLWLLLIIKYPNTGSDSLFSAGRLLI